MNCFYCGKRVSLVRKRSDTDFCSDDHREKYHARTLRTIETLREADEQIAVTRRLNEGMPLRPSLPLIGREPASLLQKDLGSPLLFGWAPTGLPASRPILETHVPAATLYTFHSARRNGAVPSPSAENLVWSIGCVQEGPRPPRAFRIAIHLPQGGPKRTHGKQAACDRPRHQRAAPTVEWGTAATAIARRIARRQDKLIGALMCIAKAPDPVQPPSPSPPITLTLRHPTLSIRLGQTERPAALLAQMPSPGVAGIRMIPQSAGDRLPAPAYVPIERRAFAIPGTAIPGTRIGAGGMPRLRELRWGNRSGPCPDGFRRRQFYSWELLERFCGVGFDTIAGHRPEMRIEAAVAVAPVKIARLWSLPLEDPAAAEPEPSRPAPPFPERVCLPDAVALGTACDLSLAFPSPSKIWKLDSRHHSPAARSWDPFAAFAPVRRLRALNRIRPAHWSTRTAEPFAIPAWARPQTRGSKRTACDLSIGVRKPVFAGPDFQAGDRRVGPTPPKHISPPMYEPAAASLRSDVVGSMRAALLPALPVRHRFLGESALLANACQAPVGRIPANRTLYPAYAILLAPALPAGPLDLAAAAGLRIHPPALRSGVPFDIGKGSPQLLERELLQRFRKRGFEAMHSRHTAPQWPTASAPGLAVLASHAPSAHPVRQPSSEAAMAMFRAQQLPAADAFRLSCTVTDSQLLSPPRPGSADWGRAPQVTGIPMPLPLMLPVDALGPIRDWGLAPPPEPDKPPEAIHEDFGAGMANWVCANQDWRQDIAGVRTGSLALLRPSLNLSDYEFEFLCRIEHRSIGCVFRAADASNYYAAQIALDPASGAAHLARFSVIGGEREQPAITPLDLPLGKSSSCRVRMSVLGNRFKLFVNDKPAFDWTDDRLPEGGVGFFSDGEDRARLYWVKVTPYGEAHAEPASPRMTLLGAEMYREIRIGV